MISFTYKVSEASHTEVQAEATLASGKVVTAMEPVLMVQLVPTDNPELGTVKLVIGDDVEESESLFQPGSLVVATYSSKSE